MRGRRAGLRRRRDGAVRRACPLFALVSPLVPSQAGHVLIFRPVSPGSRTGGRLLLDQFLVHGANRAFCVPGESFLAVLDAMHDVYDRLPRVVCRQEGGAANMAEAWDKLSGAPGSCFVTRGPGATNASIGWRPIVGGCCRGRRGARRAPRRAGPRPAGVGPRVRSSRSGRGSSCSLSPCPRLLVSDVWERSRYRDRHIVQRRAHLPPRVDLGQPTQRRAPRRSSRPEHAAAQRGCR